MKLFFAYVGRRTPTLAVLAALFLFTAAVLLLYDLPASAVGYAALLCAFVGGAFFVVDFSRYVRRHRHLTALREEISLVSDRLPATRDLIERDYQALIEAVRMDGACHAAEEGRRCADMTEYYTLWVHQVKTPIAAMKLMLSQEELPDAAALREQLFRIEQYAEMALGYLRLDGDTTDFVIAEYDLDGIVRQAVKKFASQFIRKGLRLHYEPLGTRVLTDEKWLLFVVEQLLSNALKYTTEGSISIFMEPEKTLVIRDTGIGIREEDLPRIFERGFTGRNGRAEKTSTGIGLYLCRRILLRLGHTISIKSAPGEGTAVRIGLGSAALRIE